MEIYKAREIALELMRKHGLNGWSFKLDHAKRRFGRCIYARKIIVLSAPLITLNSEEVVRDTILHEIAHALAGFRAGHGQEWRAKAEEVGAMASRCYGDEVITPPRAWTGTCPSCKRQIKRHRRQRVACSACCNGKFDSAYLFEWTKN